MKDYTVPELKSKIESLALGGRLGGVIDSTNPRVVVAAPARGYVRFVWCERGLMKAVESAKQGAGEVFASGENLLVYTHKVQESPVFRVRLKGSSFTSFAKGLLKDGGFVLERDFRKEVSFGTLTIPGRTERCRKAFEEHGGEMLNNFWQAFRDDQKTSQNPLMYLFVAEQHKDGFLHWHFAIGHHDKRGHRRMKNRVQSVWRRVCLLYSTKLGFDLFEKPDGGSWRAVPWAPRVHFVRVRKSVANYLAKYLTKGAEGAASGEGLRLKRWWGMSDALREKVEAERVKFSRECPTFDDAKGLAAEMKGIMESAGFEGIELANPFSGALCGYVFRVNPEEKAWALSRWYELFERKRFFLDSNVCLEDDTGDGDPDIEETVIEYISSSPQLRLWEI